MKLDPTDESKILILGGTGHLGSAITHYLTQAIGIESENINIFYLHGTPTESITDISGLNLIPGNILDPESVSQAFNGADFVFHTVGNTSFDPRMKKIQWLVNVEGTRNILEAYRNSETVKKLIYTSTVNTLSYPDPLGSIGTIESCNPYESQNQIHTFNSPDEAIQFANKVSNDKTDDWVKDIGIGYFDSKLAAQELVNQYSDDVGLSISSILPGTMFGSYDYLVGNGMYLISLYNNQMPGVLPGGLPLAHVMDVARGHILALKNAKKGSRYIITGAKSDNLYLKDMVKIIVEELRQYFPEKTFKVPKRVFKPRIASIGAFFTEIFTKIAKKPNPLSRDAVKCGSLPSFYTSNIAKNEIGYEPEFSFREAVKEMIKYYDENQIFSRKSRYVDKIKK